jgi:hypothetical protein
MADLLKAAESYTYQGLLSIITPVYQQAMNQYGVIQQNSARISSLAARIRAIADPATRAAAQAALEPTSRAQAAIVLDHRAWAVRWNDAMKQLAGWADKQGIAAAGPPMLLSGLGIAPIVVPASIILLFVGLIVGGFLAYEWSRTQGVSQALAPLEAAASKVAAGTMSPADFDAFAKSYKASLSAAAGAPATGDLQHIIESLALPLGLVALIVLGPKLIGMRKAAA